MDSPKKIRRALSLVALLPLISMTAEPQSQVTKLVPSDPAYWTRYGGAMDLDGDAMIVGASDTPVNGNNYAGVSYIYRRSGTTWSEEAKLVTPTGEIHDNFGTSVAIDGDLAAVGAPDFAYSSFTGTGNVYVYRRIGGAWTLEHALPGPSIESSFGRTVALDGNHLFVQSWDRTWNAWKPRVHIFEFNGTSWVQTQLIAPTQTYTQFGTGMMIEGNLAAIPDASEDVGLSTASGTVHVLRKSNGTWAEEAVLTDPIPEDFENFGAGLALSGTSIVVGAPFDKVQDIDGAGSVWVFRYAAGAWGLDQQLYCPTPQVSGGFGNAVGMDGDLVTVAASGYDYGVSGTGGAFLFRHDGTQWVSEAPFIGSEVGAGHGFGSTVRLAGTTALYGSGDPTYYGVVYVYDVMDTTGGFSLLYSPSPGKAGEDLKIRVSGGTPSAPTWLLWSTTGPGSFPILQWGLTVGLSSPNVGPIQIADAQGKVAWDVVAPLSTLGWTVWSQALQPRRLSNLSALTIIAP